MHAHACVEVTGEMKHVIEVTLQRVKRMKAKTWAQTAGKHSLLRQAYCRYANSRARICGPRTKKNT